MRYGAAVVVLAAALAAIAPAARAVDGVVEINQATALAGGVTGSDAAGFPVTIDASGSYVLTGNLAVGAADLTAITITADDVTLDLNGFTISATVACEPPPQLACSPDTPATSGIYTSNNRVTVRNGVVRNFAGRGVSLDADCHIEGVTVRHNAGGGLFGSSRCEMKDNVVIENDGDGISVFASNLIVHNVVSSNTGTGIAGSDRNNVTANIASANLGAGIDVDHGATVTGNTAAGNQLDGINAGLGSIVRGNAAYSNGGIGLNVGAGTGYHGNSMRSNGGGEVSGGLNLGGNVCGSALCPP